MEDKLTNVACITQKKNPDGMNSFFKKFVLQVHLIVFLLNLKKIYASICAHGKRVINIGIRFLITYLKIGKAQR